MMLRVMKAELYSALCNRVFWGILVAMVVMSLPMTGVGVAKRKVQSVMVFEDPGDEKSFYQYKEFIQAAISQGHYAFHDDVGKRWLIDTAAEPLLLSGGVLYQNYEELLKPPYIRQQFIEGTYYPPETENVYESWAAARILNDYSAIVLLGIVFAVYFFGQDFNRRIFSGYVLAGRRRQDIIIGKLACYLLVTVLLSLLLLAAAVICYVPTIFRLETGYILRCLGIRMLIDVGFLCVPVIFPFIFKDFVKSAVGAYLFIILFISNRAIIPLPLLAGYNETHLWDYDFSFAAFGGVLLTTVCVLAFTWISTSRIFQKCQLN